MNLDKKQEYELLASISARGEIPVKFAYLGEGAKKWDKIYSYWNQKKGVTDEEVTLLLAHLNSFMELFSNAKGINLIDLGCGNGIPVAHILKRLMSDGMDVTYTGVDISEEMLGLLKENYRREFPDLKVNAVHLDFEKESLANHILGIKQRSNYPNLLINLGNTLGNYVNVSSVLTNFMESMTLDDYLLLGNGLANDYNPQRIIDTYNVDAIVDLVTLPARSLGIFGKSDDFKYFWNSSKNRLEGRIKLGSDKQLKLADQEIVLGKGEEILVHQSNKYSESSLTKLLSDVGFRTELLTTTKSRSHILTMVQPTRYSVS